MTQTICCRDRKRKKFVGETGKEGRKKIKTESGGWISSSYKTNAYQEWMEQHKIEGTLVGEEGEKEEEDRGFIAKGGWIDSQHNIFVRKL